MTDGGEDEYMKRRQMARVGMGRRVKGIMAGTVAMGLALGTTGAGVQADAVSINASRHNPQWLVQVLFDKGNNPGQPWTLSTFQKFANEGITGVEINMDWAAVEPSPGQFNWTTLQTYLQYCQETHLKLIPIFWEYGYPGNPPTWLPGGSEITSTGAAAQEPAFWSKRAFSAYAGYMTQTLTMMGKSPAFGGAYIDYGWLDAAFGPGVYAGYAPQDITMFHQWLAERYGSIAAFNQAIGTDYASFATVPAFLPGQSHFSIYQQFRVWSYKTLLGRVLDLARKATPAPLYIYYGGVMSDVGQVGNLPDVVFALAQKYHAIVNMDGAATTTFAALFGFLSQSYKVPVIEEWTPVPGSPGQLAQWLGQYPLEGSYGAGEDYFLYSGTGQQQPYFADTYPSYLVWHSALAQVRGSLPPYKVGIMLGYDQVLHNDLGSGITGGATVLNNYLLANRPAANVFTDLSVLDGAVSLSQFHTIIDWNSDLQAPNLNPRLAADLKAFQANGGTIIPGPISANANVNVFALLNQPDGQYTVQTVLGQRAVVSQLGVVGSVPYAQYLYFKVPSTLVPPTQPNVQIQVTYANNQTNGMFLQYDSSNTAAPVNGAYTTAFPAGTNAPVAVTSIGQYQTATFDLTNAAFTGAENGGADFRIAIENPGLAISSVTITAGRQSASFTPSELSNPQAPPALVVTPSAPQVETFLSAGQGKVWLVASNTGSTAFSGTVTIPTSVLDQLMPNKGNGPLRTQSLLGSWQPGGPDSWNITLAGGGLAVLAIQPG